MKITQIESIESHLIDLEILSQESNINDLGMILPKKDEINIQINNSNFEINQSISLLNSKNSSTGFVLWKICPLFIKFILEEIDIKDKFVLELGSGISGLSSILNQKCKKIILSDQYHLLKLMRKNILNNYNEFELNKRNSKSLELNSKTDKNIEICCVDWEEIDQGLYNFRELTDETPDYIIGCDIVYNDYLIPFLIESINKLSNSKTKIIIGLQLRLLENIESFIQQLLETKIFKVSVIEELNTVELNNGFIVYLIEKF